jgi:hypothetical protein
LAYLDDLLEPSDAEDIGHRVEESEFATSIINRIHDCMRRLRLGVPPLNARGTGGDANTVAEYLDNTMAPDLVPEFERVCLESDIHLAEVAASHQILTLVLGEPAEIDPASRQRMYRLFYDPDGHTKAAKVAAAAPAKQGTRRKPQVPEYLRESDGAGWWSLAAMGGAAAALISVGLYLFWPREREVAQALQEPQPNMTRREPDANQPPVAVESVAENQEPTVDTAPVDQLPATEPSGADDVRSEDSPATTDAISGTVAEPMDETVSTNEPTPGVDAQVGLKVEPPVVASPPVAAPSDEAEATADSEVAVGSAQLGRFVTEGQVLVRHAAPNDWFRLPPREPLMVGDRIVSLPNFRGTIALTSGVTAQIQGATEIALHNGDPQGIPELAVEFGRVVLMSSGQPNARVRLRAGDQTATLTLVEASSLAGIEITPMVDAPDANAPRLQTLLFVANGAVQWQLGNEGNPQLIAAPVIQTWSGERPLQVQPADLPNWLTGESGLTDIDRRAVDILAVNVVPDRSARLTLTELANDRRSEVRSLAVRSLGVLDQFEPIVDALGDAMQRGAWEGHIQMLRSARARGPETAAKVKKAVEDRRPGSAALILRMLAGYTPEELKQGEASILAANLDHQDLAVRVLANWNLMQITGDSRYRPHDPPNLRQPQVRRWKLWAEQFERGDAKAPAPPAS